MADLGSQNQENCSQTRSQPMTSTFTSAACLLASLFQEHEQRESPGPPIDDQLSTDKSEYFPLSGTLFGPCFAGSAIENKRLVGFVSQNSSAALR